MLELRSKNAIAAGISGMKARKIKSHSLMMNGKNLSYVGFISMKYKDSLKTELRFKPLRGKLDLSNLAESCLEQDLCVSCELAQIPNWLVNGGKPKDEVYYLLLSDFSVGPFVDFNMAKYLIPQETLSP